MLTNAFFFAEYFAESALRIMTKRLGEEASQPFKRAHAMTILYSSSGHFSCRHEDVPVLLRAAS